MILLGSHGKTFYDVARILGVGDPSERIHRIFNNLIQHGQLQQDGPQYNLASGVFVQNDYLIRDIYKQMVSNVYKSDIIPVDYSRRAFDAQAIINEWIRQKTMGHIQNMLQGAPDSSNRLIITSALYFSGQWKQPFNPVNTRKAAFKINNDHSIDIDFMAGLFNFPFYQDKKRGLKILGLPYKNSNMTLYAIQPLKTGADNLRAMKNKLNPKDIDDLVNKAHQDTSKSPIAITFPKMNLTSTTELRQTLETMGLKSIFDSESSDLSLMASGQKSHSLGSYHDEFISDAGSNLENLRKNNQLVNPKLYFKDLVHKVAMNINEWGTTAAAVTSTAENKIGFNRIFSGRSPFLYFIRDDTTKLISFWGTVNNPKSLV